MKCKVFSCAIEDLESQVQTWLATKQRISLVKTTGLGPTGFDVVSLLVFYTEEAPKVDLPDVPEGQMLPCPKCGHTMCVRANKTNGDMFFGCIKYPECKGTRKFTDSDKVKYGGELDKGEVKQEEANQPVPTPGYPVPPSSPPSQDRFVPLPAPPQPPASIRPIKPDDEDIPF